MEQNKKISFRTKGRRKYFPQKKQNIAKLVIEADNPDIAKIHINQNLEITYINKTIQKLINVRDTDIGRPIYHFTTNFHYDNFVKDIKNSLETWEEKNMEITDYEDTIFNLRLLPYLQDNQECLAIVFVTSPQMTHLLEQLQAKEKTTNALLSAMPDLVVRVSDQGVLLDYLTSHHVKIKEFGFQEHYIGHLLQKVLPSPIGLQFYEAAVRVDALNKTQTLEYSVNVNQQKKHFKARIIKTELKDILIIIRDISEEYVQRKQIKENEHRLQSLFSFSPLGMAVLSTQFKYLEVNDAMCKMFGYEKKELIGKSITLTSHSTDLLWYIKKIKDQLLSGKSDFLNFEKRYVRKNGEVFTVNSLISKFNDPNCNTTRLVITLEDINEKKKAQDALKQQELLYRKALNHIPNSGIILFDKNLKISLAGGGAFKKYGVNEKRLYGKNINVVSRIFPFTNLVTTNVKKTLNGETTAFEVTLKENNYQVTIAPMTIKEGVVEEGIISFHNITDLTKVNNAIKIIAQQVAYKSDKTFFKDIVQNVGEVLGASHVFIGEYDKSVEKITTIAFKSEDIFIEKYVFPVKDTPYQYIDQEICVFPHSVQTLFPKDKYFETFGIEAYIGTPLFDKSGKLIGTLSVLNQTAFKDIELAKSIIKIFSARIGAELERSHTYQHLHASEQKFKAIFNNTFQMMNLFDKDGRLLESNEAFLQFNQAKIEDLRGKEAWRKESQFQQYTPMNKEKFDLAKQGKLVRTTKKIKNPTTKRNHTFDISLKPIYNDLKEVVFLVGEARDISDLVRVKAHLIQNEQRFRRLIEGATDIITLVDAKGIIMYQSPAVTQILGFEQSELVGVNIFDMIHPDDKKQSYHSFNKVFDGKKGFAIDYRYLHKDGSWRYLQSIAKNCLDDNILEAIIINTRDITRKKQIEEALAESENLFRNLYENSPEGIVMTDIEGKIEKANESFCNIFGYSETELKELYIHELSVKDNKIIEIEKRKQIMQGALDTYTMEKKYYRKDGSIIWGNVAISVIRNDNGNIENVIGMVEDITQRKNAEEEIKRINEELESKVKERTQALQASNEELSRFAYVTAHDLKQPLRSIGGFARLLERRYKHKLDDDGMDYLNLIGEGVKNMTELIAGLLNYAKQTDGSSSQYEVVNLNDLMFVVMLNLKDLIQESNTEIFIGKLPTELPIIRIKIIQVLQNLLANAIKFRKNNVSCKLQVTAKDCGNFWEFSVKDNGIGIEKKNLNTVFQLLKKIHNQEDYAGHGIGLATCKKIIQQHNGNIWVNSTFGEGSTFYFTLPK